MGGWGSAHYNVVDVRNSLPRGGASCLGFKDLTASEPKTSEQKNEFLVAKIHSNWQRVSVTRSGKFFGHELVKLDGYG